MLSEKDQSLIVSRKVNFMVSLKSYRIQLSSASCNYKSKMNFQKTALFVFCKCIVLGARHDWWAWLSRFCTYCDCKNEDFSNTLSQTKIKMIRRYKGCYYIRLESYYIIFYFGTDWSRIRPLPSTTLINLKDIWVSLVKLRIFVRLSSSILLQSRA